MHQVGRREAGLGSSSKLTTVIRSEAADDRGRDVRERQVVELLDDHRQRHAGRTGGRIVDEQQVEDVGIASTGPAPRRRTAAARRAASRLDGEIGVCRRILEFDRAVQEKRRGRGRKGDGDRSRPADRGRYGDETRIWRGQRRRSWRRAGSSERPGEVLEDDGAASFRRAAGLARTGRTRSNSAGLLALAWPDTPKNCGQAAGSAAATISEVKPLASLQADEAEAASGSAVAVTGLPTSGKGTACVIGLSGRVGRKRTGNGSGVARRTGRRPGSARRRARARAPCRRDTAAA